MAWRIACWPWVGLGVLLAVGGALKAMSHLFAGLNSPAVLTLTVLYLIFAAVVAYDVRAIESNHAGIDGAAQLPWWVALVYFAEWALLAAVVILNWRYGLALLAARVILKASRVLEALGRAVTYPL